MYTSITKLFSYELFVNYFYFIIMHSQQLLKQLYGEAVSEGWR